MSAEITMPQLSDTMTEGTLVKWHKKEGDKVKNGEKIGEVETDKATMEMEAFDTGTMAAILIAEGEKAPVGATLAVLATGKDDPAEIKKQYAGGAKAAGEKKADAAQAGSATVAAVAKPESRESRGAAVGATSNSGKSSAGGTAVLDRAAASVHPVDQARGGRNMSEPDNVGHGATREPATPVPPLPGRRNGDDRLRVSPLARRIAAEKKIDLHALRGSGPGGRIVKSDVLNAGPGPARAGAIALLGAGQKEVIPLTKMRAAIAKNLVASKQNIPHFYESIDVDVEALLSLRTKLNEMLEPEKIRLGLGDFIAKAVASALVKHPGINATFNGTEVTRYGDVHLGMAVSIPDGLIVPVLRNVQALSWKEIRRQSADLVERARALRLKQEEMSGATFTVSNLGTYGIREFSAIINPPQVAILAIAAAQKRAVVINDHIVARTMMTLTLSADHRVVDGAAAADFLRTLKAMLEEPALMLV